MGCGGVEYFAKSDLPLTDIIKIKYFLKLAINALLCLTPESCFKEKRGDSYMPRKAMALKNKLSQC
jgi:hypothetical protein